MPYLILFVLAVLALKHWQWALAVAVVLVVIVILWLKHEISKPLETTTGRRNREGPASGNSPMTIKIEIRGRDLPAAQSAAYSEPKRLPSFSTHFNSRELSMNTSVRVPTRGLVIKEEPLNKILQGRKTMELRGKHNRQLGPVALIKKGSGKIYAVAEIAGSVGPMSFDELRACSHEHAVEPERLREVLENGWNHGWRLKNIVPLRSPVSYVHKGMSQVNLDPAAIEALRQQLAGA